MCDIDLCPLCHLELELISRYFFHYSFACNIWDLIEHKFSMHFNHFATWYESDWINEGV